MSKSWPSEMRWNITYHIKKASMKADGKMVISVSLVPEEKDHPEASW